ncbi:TetR/AcrR family transcriptional regulator [Nocardioides mesophilus]|uniref:TetR/AcrR family transcriptional regulator n=1 Tax=Nocardioides mesophilus TaxID=433659 RepID=A0A7G9R8V5_9ACTN|nr:TetR/AcrR family transcriptional regulator [Nocardioides mesophilus]QNN52030.1 TetR/AcrR family transcriptional regulator [Nocardioides mesophilus]
MVPLDGVRPRVEGAREAEILDATLDLLIEAGFDRLTMDAVAARAHAGKATLYRRWSSKSSLVVDALLRSKRAHDLADVDTGSLRGDLLTTYCGAGGLADKDNAIVLASVMTALHTDPEFAQEFRSRFLAPKLEINRHIYARAQARGELLPGIDVELISAALAGILLHRVFLLGFPVDPTVIETVVDQIILPAATGRPYSAHPEGTS